VGPVFFEGVVIIFNLSTKAIFQSRTAFPKVAHLIKAVKDFGYGPNLSNSEHEEWRRHRRIAGPSFTERNNTLVWESSIEIILGYFTKWNRDGKGSIVKVSNFTEVTTQIAFMVFATAGVWATWALIMGWLTESDFRLWYQCGLGLGQE
jgi:cytochrome P450